jgi:hypothetical protein
VAPPRPEWIGRSVLATGGVSTSKSERELHFNHEHLRGQCDGEVVLGERKRLLKCASARQSTTLIARSRHP